MSRKQAAQVARAIYVLLRSRNRFTIGGPYPHTVNPHFYARIQKHDEPACPACQTCPVKDCLVPGPIPHQCLIVSRQWDNYDRKTIRASDYHRIAFHGDTCPELVQEWFEFLTLDSKLGLAAILGLPPKALRSITKTMIRRKVRKKK